MINNKLFKLVAFLFLLNAKAQDCNSLYLLNAQNGNVYNISALNGTLPPTFTNLSSAARSNLAVGPNPANTSQTVFTSSNTPANSAVYVSNSSIGTNIPSILGGLTANPIAASPTAGYVYGVTSNRHLIKASPAPAADLGSITGDTVWNGGTVSSDAFFDSTGRLYVIVTSGSARYVYRIEIATLQASQVTQLSGTLPNNFQGLAFYNGNIYAVEGFSTTLLLVSSFGARVYEINSNTGVSILKTSYTLNTLLGPFSGADDLDLASCQVFIPSSAPSCNELFGINGNDGITYRINFNSSGGITGTTQVATDGSGGYGNMAYGPVPSNLNQNQFVVSRNNNSGNIWRGIATSGSTLLTELSNTWGSPIGIGTDPKTGFVYGINNKALTRWTGTGNASSLGTVTGDINWTNGTTLNDIAVDSGGNLYVITSVTNTNIWLYRINPSTLTATAVTQLSGTVPNLATTNGNGLAYLGDHFYYSRINSTFSTDIWRLNAMTGVSEYVGLVSGTNTAGSRRNFGDLGSCATVTNVPAAFNFNCNAAGGGQQGAILIANGTSQSSILRIPISGAVNGLAELTLTGTGVSTSPSPYVAFIEQGANFVDIPFTYNGSGTAGFRTITVSSPRASGTCSLNVWVDKDSDGDGIADLQDLDDDNDGILDTVESVCTANSILSLSGWKATVYDAPGGTNGWSEISASNSFPTSSYSQIATFEYNEYANTTDAFDIKFNSGVFGFNNTNPDIINYVGTTIAGVGNANEDFAVVFTRVITPQEEGTYQFDLTFGDDHIFIYKNGVKVNQLQNAYVGVPVNNFANISVISGDIISVLIVEEGLVNTTLTLEGSKTAGACYLTDTDNDGIPNYLDLDSDGDSCPDAIEGGQVFTSANLVTSSMAGGNSGAGYTGTSSSPVTQNLGNTVNIDPNSSSYGVPNIAGTGQTLGDSQNGGVSSQCTAACYKPAIINVGNTYPTNQGITALGRSGINNGNWPMVRQGGWTVLESKEKGFVINRIATTAGLANITNPVEGMMVYDEEADCLKIYSLKSGDTMMAWHCFNTPACPD